MTASTKRRPDIQALRAVAVSIVVAEHVLGQPVGGFVGVDVFFVISGFLIVGLLLREYRRTGRINLVAFFGRRVRRLLPAAAVVVGVTVIAAFAVFPSGRAMQTGLDALWATALLANWHFAAQQTDYFTADGPVSPLQHLWSLSVEEQVYVVVPVLLVAVLALTRRTGRPTKFAGAAMAVTAAGSIAWALHETGADPAAAYFSSPARAWELGAGAMLAFGFDLWRRIPAAVATVLGCAGFAMIIAAATAMDGTAGFPAPAALVPVLGTALVLVSGSRSRPFGARLLAFPPLAGLGAISYSLYLWHFPVLILAPAVAAGATWFVIPLSILLATITHGLLERPFIAFPSGGLKASVEARRARRRWARTAFRGRARMAVVALGTVATVLGLAAVEESRPIETNVLDASSRVNDDATETASADGEAPPDELAVRQQALAAALGSTTWPDVHPSVDAVSAPGYLDALPRSDEWAETLGCSSAWTSSSLDECSFGAQDGKTALVVGDSSGAFTAPALRAIAERSDSEWRIVVATRYSCPWVSERISFVDDVDACEEHKRQVLDVAAELRPDVILAINVPSTTVERPGGGTASHATWARWTADMAEKTPSIRTVAMVPNPYGPDVRTCAAPQSTPARCVTTDAVNRARASAMADALGEDDVVDSSPVWCVTGKCPAFIGHELVRVDALHASPEASVQSAEALRAVLRRHDVLG